jgi:hypothetical protein
MIPFILHAKVAKEMFDHYICFMNINEIGKNMNYENLNDLEDVIEFKNYL